MNRLIDLQNCGQSYWLDNLTRKMLVDGDLARRIRDEGLRGITANPATFGQALKSDEYDQDIREWAVQGRTTSEIYEHLLVTDVKQACDLLMDVYRQTDGIDGYVSLEVSPHLAHDPEGTMQEARRYVALVDRPNLFIKIPGTHQGVIAIQQMLYEGVSVNVTLLFSVAAYQAVMEAHMAALERRAAEGLPLRPVMSVASFFLSRIDVLVDQLLSQRVSGGDDQRIGTLRGQAAVASAKLAYQVFRQGVASERWRRLAGHGARVQRPLWASTGTKNPAYRDVYYVEPLIGRDTVNTMPEATIEAFADHGEAKPDAIEQHVEQASRILEQLNDLGIDLDRVAWQLEHEGVQKFIDAFDTAVKALDVKRQRYVSHGMQALRA
ncbi:MAG: transaldolase [Nitrospiraceae bacterium]|nr:transaldolase [Nitrospiraceae bacterium]